MFFYATMKKKLINIIKYTPILYSVYYHVMNLIINVIGFFVRTDKNLILFNSYAGRKYDDSPRVIFEQMKTDERFRDTKIVWAFHNPASVGLVEGARIIRTDNINYFLTALKARVWITNSSVERGLHFKKKRTFYLNTWHGTPIKKMGRDVGNENSSFAPKKADCINAMMAQSDFEAEVFSRMFRLPKSAFIKAGLPRNDILVNTPEYLRWEIRNTLNIDPSKRIILYCPTFREYKKDENGCILVPPMDLEKWKHLLGDEYVLLFRAHYEVARVMDIQENEFVRNMTDYPVLNDLMIISDLLISDYSSVFIDYSIMDKPMLHFTYDYQEYAEKRGMYFDIREYISGAATEDGVIALVREMNTELEIDKTRSFRQHYVQYYGHATQAALDCLAEALKLN